MSETPRTLPIHASLTTPMLLLGAERRLVLMSAIIAAVLVLSLARPLFAGLGALFWCLSLAALQRAAKNDPQLSQTYRRHLRYAQHYDAQARATASPRAHREEVPC